MAFHDLAREYSITTGTSDAVLSGAVPGCLTWDLAGVTNGETVRYTIVTYSTTTNRPTHSEEGVGTYTTSTKTLARTTIKSSTNGGSKITLTGLSEVFITPDSVILNSVDPYGLHHRLSGSHADDDEFDTDTSASYTAVTPAGTANWSIANHALACQFTNQDSSDAAAFLKSITLANGEWLETSIRVNASSVNYTFAGLVLSDGTTTTSNAICISTFRSASVDVTTIRADYGTLTNLATAGINYDFGPWSFGGALRLRLIRNSSTAYTWTVSDETGSKFYGYSVSTVNPGFTPTKGGVFVSTWGSVHEAVVSFDYLRHMS